MRRALALALVTVAVAAARAGGATVVKDQMGLDVTLATFPPARIVCLAPSDTEILFAMGAGALVVGRDSYSDFPSQALAVPVVGSDYEPSLERILGLKPDVVITATTANLMETHDALGRLHLPVYTTRTETLQDLPKTIDALGLLIGQPEAARALRQDLARRLEAVRAKAAAARRVPALIVVWSEPLYVVGGGSYTSELLELAGGANVAGDAGTGFPKYPLERVLKLAPEVIVIGSHKNPGAPDPSGYWKRWTSLPAVRDGRVVPIDGDLLFRSGPRVADGAEALLRILHPELAK